VRKVEERVLIASKKKEGRCKWFDSKKKGNVAYLAPLGGVVEPVAEVYKRRTQKRKRKDNENSRQHILENKEQVRE